MYNIYASFEKDKNTNKWKLLGYDQRPLRFVDYATAERECMRLAEEDKHLYPEEVLNYVVVEEK